MRDYLQVVKALEGYYSKCRGNLTVGGVPQVGDEELRSNLVNYANSTYREVERANRWRLAFKATTFVTTPGTSSYFLVNGRWLHFHRIYWRESTGAIVPLELVEQREARLLYGDGPNAARGKPRMYSILENSNIQLYPTPDNGGPDSGNYTLQIEYYSELPQLIETTGTTAASTTLTVPSTVYLTAAGADAANATADKVVVRSAGGLTGIAAPYQNDDFLIDWTAFPTPTTVTLGAQPTVVVTSQQTFFYATNWLIDVWPKVLIFGMLREIATYLKDTTGYTTWEGRYQKELEDLMEWDQQSRHDQEVFASGVAGQRQGQFRGLSATYPWGNSGVW